MKFVKRRKFLRESFHVESDIWSLTSVNELTREGQAVDRWNLLHPEESQDSLMFPSSWKDF